MADTLVGKTCTPCKGGIPPLTRQEGRTLSRARFRNGSCATTRIASSASSSFAISARRSRFVQKVGELAESEAHHPDISFGWGYATVSLQTKKIKGLHENDFILAAKIDRLARSGKLF